MPWLLILFVPKVLLAGASSFKAYPGRLHIMRFASGFGFGSDFLLDLDPDLDPDQDPTLNQAK